MWKRFFVWKLPLTAALLAAVVFGFGFFSVVRGSAGHAISVPVAPLAEPRSTGKLNITIVGDSLARGTGDQTGLGIGGNLSAMLEKRKIPLDQTVNLAVNGAKTGDLLRTLQSRNVQQILAESNIIVVSIGGNDLFGDVSSLDGPPKNPEEILDRVSDRVRDIVKEIRSDSPQARVFLIGLYNPFIDSPWGAQSNALVNRWNAKLVEDFQDDRNLTVVQTSDIFSHRHRLSLDRFHPGTEGYQIISERIAESL
ncbi:MAG: GDSL-type esterase/lipase family protein [Acidobacteriota bacterium]